MRHRTPKRAAIDRAARPMRESLVFEIGRCEHCGRRTDLACHEILRGNGYRLKVLTERCALLVLCWNCNSNVMGGKSWAFQLARLYMSRQSDYDLERFWWLADRRLPEQEEVDAEIERILGQDK